MDTRKSVTVVTDSGRLPPWHTTLRAKTSFSSPNIGTKSSCWLARASIRFPSAMSRASRPSSPSKTRTTPAAHASKRFWKIKGERLFAPGTARLYDIHTSAGPSLFSTEKKGRRCRPPGYLCTRRRQPQARPPPRRRRKPQRRLPPARRRPQLHQPLSRLLRRLRCPRWLPPPPRLRPDRNCDGEINPETPRPTRACIQPKMIRCVRLANLT
jgi:hypothetical protein